MSTKPLQRHHPNTIFSPNHLYFDPSSTMTFPYSLKDLLLLEDIPTPDNDGKHFPGDFIYGFPIFPHPEPIPNQIRPFVCDATVHWLENDVNIQCGWYIYLDITEEEYWYVYPFLSPVEQQQSREYWPQYSTPTPLYNKKSTSDNLTKKKIPKKKKHKVIGPMNQYITNPPLHPSKPSKKPKTTTKLSIDSSLVMGGIGSTINNPADTIKVPLATISNGT